MAVPRSASMPSKLSPSEARLYKLLPANGTRVTTEELASRYWSGKVKPFNARIVVSNLVRALVRKTGRHDARVRKTKPTGPRSTMVWLEKRAA